VMMRMDNKGAALVAVGGGLIIFAVKLGAWYISGSVALLSDALESIINIAASCLMLYSVYISGKPADDEHHYGHQKVEYITSLTEGGLIITAAIFIIHTALERISNPAPITSVESAVGINLFATALNGVLSWYLIRRSKETGSIALEGDAKHLLSDVVTSVGVAFGLYISLFTGWTLADPIIALIVSVLIIRMGAMIILKSSRGLMDPDCPETEEKIEALLDRHRSRFVDYHDIKTRRSGSQVFAELHLSIDGDMTVKEAHDFTDHLEDDLKKELPEVTVTIHVEPPEDHG
jgi:cation diffusion facilitator family transporter